MTKICVGNYTYNEEDLIGNGNFAKVYKGHLSKDHSKTVAIKKMSEEAIKYFSRSNGELIEVKILKDLTKLKNTNIIACIDFIKKSQDVYLITNYCNGGDLSEYLYAMNKLDEHVIQSFIKQFANAMFALNTKKIVHLDLKPANILLSNESSDVIPILKLADFGLAKYYLPNVLMNDPLCGMNSYSAPEMSSHYDARVDLWSIGAIIFECLTGEEPNGPDLIEKIPNNTREEFKKILGGLLERNPKNRMSFEEFFKYM